MSFQAYLDNVEAKTGKSPSSQVIGSIPFRRGRAVVPRYYARIRLQ